MEYFLWPERTMQVGQKSQYCQLVGGNRHRAGSMRRAFHFDGEPIVCGLHIRRELRAQSIKVEVGMEIREDCARGLDTLYPGERIIYTEMAGMRTITQSIHHPDIEPLQRRDRGLR